MAVLEINARHAWAGYNMCQCDTLDDHQNKKHVIIISSEKAISFTHVICSRSTAKKISRVRSGSEKLES